MGQPRKSQKPEQAKPAGDAGQSVKVTSRPASFRRCGYAFSAEPTLIALDQITEEQLETLQDESMLVTEIVDTPAAAETETKA
jgi:hypothetical protein